MSVMWWSKRNDLREGVATHNGARPRDRVRLPTWPGQGVGERPARRLWRAGPVAMDRVLGDDGSDGLGDVS